MKNIIFLVLIYFCLTNLCFAGEHSESIDGFNVVFIEQDGKVISCNNKEVYWVRPDFNAEMERKARKIEHKIKIADKRDKFINFKMHTDEYIARLGNELSEMNNRMYDMENKIIKLENKQKEIK